MRKGFTLVELITVIIIIAVLAALALPQYTRVVERGQASKAKASLDMIRKAQGIYYSLYSGYAGILTNVNLVAEVPELVNASTGDADWRYGLRSATASSFSATAVRQRGAYSAAILQISNDGKITSLTPAYVF